MKASVLIACCLLAAALVMAGPLRPAWSHAEIVKSSPADGASLTAIPAEIRAWFSEQLAGNSVIRLYDASNAVLAVGGIDLKDYTHTVMRLVPPLLKPGTYEVRWTAVAADDYGVTHESFKFTVQ